MRKELGRITDAYFGLGGYQDHMIGIHFTLEGPSWGCGDTNSMWDTTIDSKNAKWTEVDRTQKFDEIIRYISDLLARAKVDRVERLKGIPVEVEFEHNSLKNWRILTEVL